MQDFQDMELQMEMVPVIGPGLPSSGAQEYMLHGCSTRHED